MYSKLARINNCLALKKCWQKFFKNRIFLVILCAFWEDKQGHTLRVVDKKKVTKNKDVRCYQNNYDINRKLHSVLFKYKMRSSLINKSRGNCSCHVCAIDFISLSIFKGIDVKSTKHRHWLESYEIITITLDSIISDTLLRQIDLYFCMQWHDWFTNKMKGGKHVRKTLPYFWIYWNLSIFLFLSSFWKRWKMYSCEKLT